MTEHPHLLHEAPHSWRLDPQTRELGRRGVARARAVLAEAARRQDPSSPLSSGPAAHSPDPTPEHRSAA